MEAKTAAPFHGVLPSPASGFLAREASSANNRRLQVGVDTCYDAYHDEASSGSKRRQAWNGKYYDYPAFLAWYGLDTAPRAWAEARDPETFQISLPLVHGMKHHHAECSNCHPVLVTAVDAPWRFAVEENSDAIRAVWV